MLISDINNAIDYWIEAISTYDYNTLCKQPPDKSWSVGQMCMHIAADTRYFLEQVRKCVSGNDHMDEQMLPLAKTIFASNALPDEKLIGPSTYVQIPQPVSKETLAAMFEVLKQEVNIAGILISKSGFNGKTKHEGLGYFNATEWLQFAEMHLRHHIRQRKRIDTSLRDPETA